VTNKGLVISRVPQKKKSMFIKLAEEEFADDYGMCLSSLLDYYYLLSPMIARIDSMDIRLFKLEGRPEQPPAKKKMMSGKEIGE